MAFSQIIKALGFDPLRSGTIMLVNMEMATTTTAFGLVLFVMKGVAPPDTTMADIYRAGFLFLFLYAVAMALIMALPALVLYLPGKMGRPIGRPSVGKHEAFCHWREHGRYGMGP